MGLIAAVGAEVLLLPQQRYRYILPSLHSSGSLARSVRMASANPPTQSPHADTPPPNIRLFSQRVSGPTTWAALDLHSVGESWPLSHRPHHRWVLCQPGRQGHIRARHDAHERGNSAHGEGGGREALADLTQNDLCRWGTGRCNRETTS